MVYTHISKHFEKIKRQPLESALTFFVLIKAGFDIESVLAIMAKYLGLDKLRHAFAAIKQNGGIIRSLMKLYRYFIYSFVLILCFFFFLLEVKNCRSREISIFCHSDYY